MIMDPLTIAGLVSNVFQFLSFGHEVLSTSREVLSSTNGAPREVLQLQALVRDIKEATKAASGSESLRTSDPIYAIASECERLADNLLKDLKKFERSAKQSGAGDKAYAVKIAVLFTWKKKQITERKLQLLEFEDRLNKWWMRKEHE